MIRKTTVKPVLTQLILDQPVAMNRRAQAILATWIATKVMTAEYSEPEYVVTTPDERSHLMATGSPPASWKIWIARQTGKIWRTGYARNSVTLEILEPSRPIALNRPPAKNTQLVTIGIGHLVIHVFTTHVSMIDLDYPNKVALFRIYPFDSDFLWPPASILNGAQIDFLQRDFDRYLDGIPWRSSRTS